MSLYPLDHRRHGRVIPAVIPGDRDGGDIDISFEWPDHDVFRRHFLQCQRHQRDALITAHQTDLRSHTSGFMQYARCEAAVMAIGHQNIEIGRVERAYFYFMLIFDFQPFQIVPQLMRFGQDGFTNRR